MSGRLKLEFAPFATPAKGVLVLFCEEGVKFGSAARRALDPTGDLVMRAAAADRFKGKNGSALDLVAPPGLDVSRLVVVGVGKARDLKGQDFVKLGGVAMGKVPASASEATLIADLPGGAIRPERAADLALGAKLRAYAFDRYKTKRKKKRRRPPRSRSQSRLRASQRRRRRLPRAPPSLTAWQSRAISSTSRPTCSTRKNSRAAPVA